MALATDCGRLTVPSRNEPLIPTATGRVKTERPHPANVHSDQHYFAVTRYRVASPTPSSREIARQEAPDARRAAILEASTTRRGRPSRVPFACALRRPA